MTERRPLLFIALQAPLAALILAGTWLCGGGAGSWGLALALLALSAYGHFHLIRWSAGTIASEQRLRAIFDHAMVGIGRVSLDQRWIEANPALCAMFGYSAGELAKTTFIELTHPDDIATSLEQFSAVRRGERTAYSREKRYIRKDGSILHAFIAAQGIFDRQGNLDCFAVVIEDISQRHEAQKQLAYRIERSSLLLDLPNQAERMPEPEFMQYVLERAEALTGSGVSFTRFIGGSGATPEGVIWSRQTLEKHARDVFDEHCPLSQADVWTDAVHQKAPVIINGDAKRSDPPDGRAGPARTLTVPVVEGGEVRMVTGVGNKATDYDALDIETIQLLANETWRIVRRQRIEKALQLATQVVNASPVVCFRWAASPGRPVVFVSDNVQRWGYSPEDLQAGRPPFAELVHPDDLDRIVAETERNTTAGMSGYEQEYRLITADNQVIWVVDRTQVIRREDDGIAFFDGVLTDITERKAQQLALADNLRRQQGLNKRLEEASSQLLQSEKMASIGQLAAGIAHELNNPIGFVHSNLGTLDGYLHDLMAIIEAYDKATRPEHCACPQLPGVERLMEELDFGFLKGDIFNLVAESKEGLGRVRKIVQDLKSFSRVGEQEWQEADLHQGLDSTLNIVWNELKYKCKVVKEYGDIPPVYCLISQLNQVFMNLLVNASHAIETQGTVTIRTRPHGGDSVCVEIADTGKGIAPEHLNRIFEPFFTTKPVGKGTGLGLSLSYNIVQRHHGRIEVDSQPGQGTTFRVILPICPPSAEPAQGPV